MGITIIDVRALSVIGALSVPFFLILGLYAVNIALTHTTWPYPEFQGGNGVFSPEMFLPSKPGLRHNW